MCRACSVDESAMFIKGSGWLKRMFIRAATARLTQYVATLTVKPLAN